MPPVSLTGAMYPGGIPMPLYGATPGIPPMMHLTSQPPSGGGKGGDDSEGGNYVQHLQSEYNPNTVNLYLCIPASEADLSDPPKGFNFSASADVFRKFCENKNDSLLGVHVWNPNQKLNLSSTLCLVPHTVRLACHFAPPPSPLSLVLTLLTFPPCAERHRSAPPPDRSQDPYRSGAPIHIRERCAPDREEYRYWIMWMGCSSHQIWEGTGG